eukprot:m.32199 g.32199  ORF g.32199 m.32199 type:complete len:353 (-) comp5485_c0_seq1:76-1134(-)
MAAAGGAATAGRPVEVVLATPTVEKPPQESLPAASICGQRVLLKHICLTILVVETTALYLALRASRTRKAQYIAGTAVAATEILKFVICCVVLSLEHGSPRATFDFVRTDIRTKPGISLKLLVPAVLYTVQNNLVLIGVSYVDAATSAMTRQLKIPATALLTVVVLGRHLSATKWISIVLLMVGVALVQLSSLSSNKPQLHHGASENQAMVGLVCLLLSCCTSAFAAVYFEKIIKGSRQVSHLWVMNLQLAAFSAVISAIGLFFQESALIQTAGIFQGYTWLTWLVVVLQALDGLVIAYVMKYADNILKGFGTSLAIIFTAIFALLLKDFVITLQFVVGTVAVIVAVGLYAK